MATRYSPSIVRNGLVLCLDAGLNRSTNALADTGHPTKAGLTYGGPGVEEDYQPTGCKLISRADKTIAYGNDLRAYDSNTQGDWAGPATGDGAYFTKVSGSSSNCFYGYLGTGYGFTSNPVVGRRYRLLVRAKSSSSIHLRFYDGAGGYHYFSADVGTTLKTYTHDFTCQHATGCFIYGTSSFSDGETVYFDRYEVYELSPWLDVSGNDNHAEMVNAPTFSAESGAGGTKSFDFDGTSDYLDCGDTGTIGDQFTYSVWFKTGSSTASEYRMLINVDGNANGNPQLRLYNGNVHMRFYNDNTLATSGTYWDQDWHQAVGGINGDGDYFLYVDGVSQGTLTPISYTLSWSGNTRIGKYNYAGGKFFEGKITIAHVYNRALTAAEIQQNYIATKGRFGL